MEKIKYELPQIMSSWQSKVIGHKIDAFYRKAFEVISGCSNGCPQTVFIKVRIEGDKVKARVKNPCCRYFGIRVERALVEYVRDNGEYKPL